MEQTTLDLDIEKERPRRVKEGIITGKRRILKESLLTADMEIITEKYRDMIKTARNRKPDPELVPKLQIEIRELFIGLVLGSVIRHNEHKTLGIVAEIGFSNREKTTPYFKVVKLEDHIEDIWETSWDANLVTTLTTESLDMLEWKYVWEEQ